MRLPKGRIKPEPKLTLKNGVKNTGETPNAMIEKVRIKCILHDCVAINGVEQLQSGIATILYLYL